MSSDGAPERAIDIENLERDNGTAFSNLRSIVAALRGIRKLEDDLFNGDILTPESPIAHPQLKSAMDD
jgi:hypothetical protein